MDGAVTNGLYNRKQDRRHDKDQGSHLHYHSHTVSDEDFEALKQYAKSKNFTYDRQSEKVLRNLKEVAEFEGYLEEDSTAFKELEAKLTPNLEKDFDRFKDEVKRVMAAEIVKRYYYQRGELQESLKDDLVLEKALEVLGDPDLYRRTLSVPVELEAATKGTE